MKLSILVLLYLGVVPLTLQAQVLETDEIAENMLVYQRSIGGWPKAVGKIVVDYNKRLSEAEKKAISGDSLRNDATIDNKATCREIRHLILAAKAKHNLRYLAAARKGVDYLLMAQYENGGWSQYYPDHSAYRGEITYNDNAMVNVLNILQDIVEAKNAFDQLNVVYQSKSALAVQKGIACILKTQVRVNGIPTVWCAQYDEKTLKPANARSFELISLSGAESVGITEFLMRIEKPSTAIVNAVKNAVNWFEKSKIEGYDFVFVEAKGTALGKDRVLVKKPGMVLWARFYDIVSSEPFFCGRDSVKRKTVAEIEQERRVGYAWYGTWPAALLQKKYPAWLKKI